MLPRNQRMELLSRAYVRAVAAHAGFTCDDVESDFGVDLAIRAVEWENGGYHDLGVVLDVQLKSTTIAGVRFADTEVFYELPVRNYRHLRKETKNGLRRVLVLYLMPVDETSWLSQDRDGITLHHCCYYLSLKGFPETANQNTVTVTIPRANMFSPNSLQYVLLA